MIKAVIFDYGGVIKDGHTIALDIGEIYNISVEQTEEAKEKVGPLLVDFDKGVISEDDFWEELSKVVGKPVPENAKKLARENYRKTFVIFPEMIDLVKELKGRGITTAVLSNILNFQAEVIREKEGYKEFDVVILSYEEGLMKPDLDIYHLAIKRLGVRPEECIFVDDREKNLLPAASLGMKIILAKSPEQVVKDVFSIINFPVE